MIPPSRCCVGAGRVSPHVFSNAVARVGVDNPFLAAKAAKNAKKNESEDTKDTKDTKETTKKPTTDYPLPISVFLNRQDAKTPRRQIQI